MDILIAIFTGTLIATTPLLFAALGELIVEKSGVLNLGIEGMMLIGAAIAFWLAFAGYTLPIAFLGGALAGALAAGIFAFLSLSLLANQYATGLALAIFGSGVSAMIGSEFGSTPIEPLQPLHIPVLSDMNTLGPLIFNFDILVYVALLWVPVTALWLYRTKAGLILRTVGESPETAHAIGHSPIRVRYLAVIYGGAMAGLAGAYLSVAYTAIWIEDMTAGRGWIALSLVVFAAWRPYRLLAGAILFGGMTILQIHGQILGLPFPSEALSAVPYVATIVVLVMISQNRASMRLDVPVSLAKPYKPDA